MKITNVKVTTLDFGKQKARSNAILTTRARKIIVVEVFTNEGITGVSVASGSGGSRVTTAPYVEGPLKDVICGEDPFDVEKIWDKMYRSWRKPVAKGDLFFAISDIDVAIWDIMGKTVGKPVWKILGGFRDKVPAYAAGGNYVEGEGIKELVEECSSYVSMGYKAFKMKVGRVSLKEDIERVKAVREAIGDGIDLMLDANTKFTAAEANRFIKTMEQFNPFWFEEPVCPDDIRGYQEVRAATWVPIAAGENEFTRWGCRELIENRAIDIIQPDVGIAGGFTECRKIAAMADAHHIYVAPHGRPLIHVHLVAAVPNGLIVEITPSPHYDELVGFRFEVKDGYINVPQRPGLGIELDKKVIDKYRI
ncbi:mandelate racemase/muconate lactonizing enzyme family protein [Chloroflexota bacterium]